MYDLLLSSESDSDDCEIDIIAALSQEDNITKNNYLKKWKLYSEFTLRDEFSDEKKIIVALLRTIFKVAWIDQSDNRD